jgi:hypothetical protein
MNVVVEEPFGYHSKPPELLDRMSEDENLLSSMCTIEPVN